jgi:hypothetical protein
MGVAAFFVATAAGAFLAASAAGSGKMARVPRAMRSREGRNFMTDQGMADARGEAIRKPRTVAGGVGRLRSIRSFRVFRWICGGHGGPPSRKEAGCRSR